MNQGKLPRFLLVFLFVIVEIIVEPIGGSLSYENKNIVKIKLDPTRYQYASAYRNNKKNIFSARYLNTTTTRENKNIDPFKTSRLSPLGVDTNHSLDIISIVQNNARVPPPTQYKKWQVGRVSRKQYEIINMLWRKTKVFIDVESTTAAFQVKRNNESESFIENLPALRQPFPRFSSRPNLLSTTPSYIEFYYLDEADEHIKETTRKKTQVLQNKRTHQLRNLGNFKFVLADSPIFSFRIDDPNFKMSAIPTRYMQPTNRMKRRKIRTESSLMGFDPLNSITPTFKYQQKQTQHVQILTKTTTTSTSDRNKTLNATNTVTTSKYFNDESFPYTTKSLTAFNYTTGSENNTTATTTATTASTTTTATTEPIYTINMTHGIRKTTVYDKIKFFEIYDKQTPVPYSNEKEWLNDMDKIDIYIRGNELNSERKILLEHVDQIIGNEHSHVEPQRAKHAKKSIIDNYISENDKSNNKSIIVTKVIKNLMNNVSKVTNVTMHPKMKISLFQSKVPHRKSKLVEWYRYPFAAAYVYEPSQVRCDAAGISPHWLITSGSCLSRHHKNPGGQGRSAFVTYCGESWWNPERVAYVKYSLVHPRFHPRDKTRRHLYNIGLIQVVTSMASACNGWSSIALMSHQFVAEPDGSTANAIGWGLDRFDTRYSSSELPKSFLMSYENQVFSDSCPGNVGYSKAKSLDEEGGIKNVYCLALPPYSGEENDPIHGGLLLVGGKLVALYLQEERRSWGEQCAQYTGTWRLVPWVLDVARENEETDTFTLEI